jgi:NADP-dependent aldehyde dehydrogenase
MARQRVLITGAAGAIGRIVVSRLRRPGRVLRLLDTEPCPLEATEDVEMVVGSITDTAVMASACDQIDAVIHLAAVSKEDSWESLLDVNVHGTRTVLEAVRAAGVDRVILASSTHVAGFSRADESGPGGCPTDRGPRPDTYYGFSKAATEALGSLYHSRFGTDVICVRIGSFGIRPPGAHALSDWLSPDDCVRLFEACLQVDSPGFIVVWGVSNNSRRVHSADEALAIGFHPVDDAEMFANDVLSAHGHDDRSEHTYLGGALFTTVDLGVRMQS